MGQREDAGEAQLPVAAVEAGAEAGDRGRAGDLDRLAIGGRDADGRGRSDRGRRQRVGATDNRRMGPEVVIEVGADRLGAGRRVAGGEGGQVLHRGRNGHGLVLW